MESGCQEHESGQDKQRYEMDGSPLQVRDLSSILFASSFQFVCDLSISILI